jgi:hypothetical protein
VNSDGCLWFRKLPGDHWLRLKYAVAAIIIITTTTTTTTTTTYQDITKLRNYRKQPYWALHTYFGKC